MKLFSFALLIFVSTQMIAQEQNPEQTNELQPTNSKTYIGVGGGINNVTSLAGFSIETPLSKNVSMKVGLGVGGWGAKMAIAGKYYANYPNSSSIGAGFSRASGAIDVPIKIENNGQVTDDVLITEEPAYMLDFVFGKAWGNTLKFNVELGYSIKLAGGDFKVKNNKPISDPLNTVMKMYSPGGLILGIGIAYGF